MPDASNDGYFANTTAGTSTLSASGTTLGLTFANTGAMTFLPTGATRTLTLGTSGITMNSGAAAVTFGQNTTTRLDLSLAGSQTWTNNSASTLTINNYVSPSVSGTTTLTLAGSGNFSFPNSSNIVIGNGGGVLALKLDSLGTTTIGGGNTFTGGVRVSAGFISITSTGALGSNVVNITGSATFSVAAASNISFANNFSIDPGATATLIGKGVAPNQFGYSGIISGAGAIVLGSDANKQGVFLSGSNSFLGGASINTNTSTLAINNDYALSTGTITIGNSSNFDSYRAGGVTLPNNPVVVNTSFTYAGTQPVSFGSGAVTLNASPTITTSGSTSLTFGGTISGGFGITKAGASTLVLGGANTYTGVTTLNNGTLRLTNQNALQNSTLTLSGTGSLSLDASVSENAFTFGGLSTANAAASLALQNSAATAVTLTVGGNNASTTYAGGLTGPGSLTKTGTGTLTLSGTNTYAGTTRVDAGVLAVPATSALYGGTTANWTAANLTTGSGATLALTVGSAGPRFTSANLDTLLGMTSTGSTGFLGGSRIGIDTTGTSFTYATNIGNTNGGANALGLTKLGTGTLALSGSNTYTGPTTLAAGVVQVGDSSAISGGSVLSFTGGTLQGGISGVTVSSPIRNSTSAITIDPNSQSITFSGSIDSTNSAGLTIATGGTVTLSGNNSYSGTTALSQSTLTVVIGGNSAFGTSRVNAANNNTANGLSASRDVVLTNTVSLNTSIGISGSNSIELAGTTYFGNPTGLNTTVYSNISGGKLLTISGPLYLQASGSSGNATATLGGTGNTLISNAIRDSDTGSGSAQFLISNSGTTTITGSNSYSGGTKFTLGTTVLVLGNDAALGTGGIELNASPTFSGSTNITLRNNLWPSTNSRTLTNTFSGGSTLTFAGTISLQESGTGVGRTLSIAGSGNTTFFGPIVNGGTAGNGSLTINNTGLTTFSGTNTYSGTTSVSAGVLLLNSAGALSGSSSLTIGGGVLGLGTGNSSFTRSTGGGAGQVQWNGPGGFAAFGSDAIVNLGGVSGTVTAPNNMTLGATAADKMVDFQNVLNLGSGTPKTLQVNDGSAAIDAKLSGPVVGTAVGLTKTGAGTLWLTGSSTFTSGLTISEGAVAVDTISGTASANPLGQGSLTLGSGTTAGTLRYIGTTASTNRAFTLGGPGGAIEANGSGPLTVSGTLVGSGVRTLTLGGTTTWNNSMGTITDSGSTNSTTVAKTGVGRWLLSSSTSSFTGGVQVQQGELVLAASTTNDNTGSLGAEPGSGASAVVGSNSLSGTAALLLQQGFTVGGRVINVSGSATQVAILGGSDTSGTATFDGTTGSEINLARDVQLQAANEGTVLFRNPWTFTSGSAKAITVGSSGNAGTVRLDSVLGTTGQFLVQAGTLVTAAGAMPNTSAINVNGATLQAVDYAASAPLALHSAGFATISGTGLTITGAVTNANTTADALDFSSTSGAIALNGGLSGAGSTRFRGGASISGTVSQGTVTIDGVATLGTLSGGTLGLNGATASITTLSGGRVNLANNVALSVANGTFADAITGAGSLTKTTAGKLALSGSNNYSGATSIAAGTLAVNGSIASAVTVASGATLGGSGQITSSIGGDGLIAPGNSPGILQVDGQVIPTGSTAFAFELTQTGDPTWSNATASGNDVLRLTNAAPFQSPLTSSNVVNVYFDVTSLVSGDIFRGGFFSDKTSGQLDFAGAIGSPTYAFFVYGSGTGSTNYNGKNYFTLAQYMAANPSVTGITTSVVTVGAADYANGTVTNGQVTQFVVVPEPATMVLAAVGLALGGWAAFRRRT